MYKVVWFGRFKEGVNRDEAWAHLREVHAPLVRAVPQIDAFVQSYATGTLTQASMGAGLAPGPDDPQRPYDGYALGWYRDEATFRESLRTDEWATVRADAATVFDPESFWGMSAIVDPHAIIDGDYGPLKTVYVMRFHEEIRRDPQLTREAHARWVETHGHHFGVQVPGISRYVQNHVVEALGADGPDGSIDVEICGLSECWFEDDAAHELAMSSPEWLAMNQDAEVMFDTAFSMAGMCARLEESVAKGADGSRLV